MKLINKSKHSKKEHFQFLIVCLAQVIDGMVGLLSLGFVNCELTPFVLFELFDDS